MFGLLRGLLQQWWSPPSYQVLILGLDGAGKTTCLEQLKRVTGGKQAEPVHVRPTIGLNVARLHVKGKRGNAKLLLWDLGGQESLRSIWDKYFSDANALVFVLDAADKPRLDEAHMELRRLLQEEKLASLPVLLLANKQDLQTALTADDICTLLAFSHENPLLARRSFHIQHVAAIDGSGLHDGLQWLIDAMRS